METDDSNFRTLRRSNSFSSSTSFSIHEQHEDRFVVYLKGTQSGIGLKICGGLDKDGGFSGIFIRKILKGGLANSSGNLFAGDKICEVNGEEMVDISRTQAMSILKSACQTGVVKLVVDRSQLARDMFSDAIHSDDPHSLLRSAMSTLRRSSSATSLSDTRSERGLSRASSIVSQNSSFDASFSGKFKSLLHSDVNKLQRRSRSPSLDSGLPHSLSPYQSTGASDMWLPELGPTEMISIHADTILGIEISGGKNEDDGPYVYVSDIISGGDAENDGRLQVGDVIVAINGEACVGVTKEQAKYMLTRLKLAELETYEIAFARNAQPNKEQNPTTIQRSRTPSFRADQSLHASEESSKSHLYPDRKVIPNGASSSGEDDRLMKELVNLMTDLHDEEETETENVYENYELATLRNSFKPDIVSTPDDFQRPVIRNDPTIRSTRYSPTAKSKNSRKFRHFQQHDPSYVSDLDVSGSELSFDGSVGHVSVSSGSPIKLGKLEFALSELYEVTPDQKRDIRNISRPNVHGFVTFGDYVNAAQSVLGIKIFNLPKALASNSYSFKEASVLENPVVLENPLNRSKPPNNRPELLEDQNNTLADTTMLYLSNKNDELSRLKRERDNALKEIKLLRDSLHSKSRANINTEEELNKTRHEVSTLKGEADSLRNKVRLAAEAQRASQTASRDYKELVQKLQNDVSTLKKKKEPPQKEFADMQKRLVVMGSQLRKADLTHRTHEVAIEKLTKFVEHVHLSLHNESKEKQGDTRKKHVSFDIADQLSKEAMSTIRSVKMLLDEEPLPFGWEEVYHPDGTRYFINHVTQSTTYKHPVSGIHRVSDEVNNNMPLQMGNKSGHKDSWGF